MSDWWVKALEWGGLIGAGSVTSHFLTKRKYNAQTDGELIRNAKEVIAEYKELRDVYKSDIEENRREIERLRELIKKNQEDCDETNKLLSARIASLEKEIAQDKKLIETLNQKLKTVEKN